MSVDLRYFLIEQLALPFASWRMGNSLASDYRLLKQSQYWTEQKLRGFQTNRLNRFLHSVLPHVPFYRDWCAEHKMDLSTLTFPQDLERLPVLDKNFIRQHPGSMFLAEHVLQSQAIPYSTSGSTGEPFRFMVSRQLVGNKIARYFREMEAWGVIPGKPFLKVWGAGRVGTPGTDQQRDAFTRYVLRRSEAQAFGLGTEQVRELVQSLAQKPYQALEAYTSTAVWLAQEAIRNPPATGFPHLRAVVVSGETLTPPQTDLIRQAFNVPVINAYGNREFGRLAFSCPDCSCLHFSQEDFYAEYLDCAPPDPDGRKRLVLTCLSNEVQPFVRYDTGDLVVPGEQNNLSEADRRCSCGRGLEKWNSVVGRSAELIQTPSGCHLSVHFLTLLLEDHQDQVRQFQAVLHTPQALVLLVVPGPGYNASFETFLYNRLREELGAEMKVEIRVCEEIPVVGDGKRPLLRNLVTDR